MKALRRSIPILRHVGSGVSRAMIIQLIMCRISFRNRVYWIVERENKNAFHS